MVDKRVTLYQKFRLKQKEAKRSVSCSKREIAVRVAFFALTNLESHSTPVFGPTSSGRTRTGFEKRNLSDDTVLPPLIGTTSSQPPVTVRPSLWSLP